MFFLVDFFFNLIFFVLKLYSLVDRNYIFSANGGKLKKYILRDNLQNIASNFNNTENKNFIQKIFYSLKEPPNIEIIKKFFIINFVSITVIILKSCFSYSFFISNFLYLNVFNKNIDLISIFEGEFIYFKIIYFLTYSFNIYYLVYVIFKRIYKITKKQNIKEKSYDFDIPFVNLYSKNNDKLVITKAGLFQNILIIGSIGSGKTSSAISNILFELLSFQVFGLVIDVKGNYINTVRNMAKINNLEEKIVEISLESKYKYNPLASNISTFELASRLKKVLSIVSGKTTSDTYWLDKAESYIRDLLTIIKGYSNNINFHELHMMVVNKEYLYQKLELVKDNILNNKYNEEELFNINSAMLNIKNEYLKLDERTIGIIKSEVTRITNVFVSDINIYNQFCTSSRNIDFEEDKIYVLSIDIGKNKQLAKIISTYLKLEFQSQILSRKNIIKPVFFICDEYQEVVNEQDASFFALSREYECINVISMQSYTSLLNELGNESATKVIIQNFVNKICFRNDDVYTVSEVIKQIGKEITKYETINYSESSQNSRYSIVSNNFRNYKSGLSKSQSFSERKEYSLAEEHFTHDLKTFEALMLISNGEEIQVIKKFRLKRWDEEIDKK